MERVDVAVTYDGEKGWYVGRAPELRTFTALSLSSLRQQIEAALLPESGVVTLNLDRAARRERDRRRRGGYGGAAQWRR